MRIIIKCPEKRFSTKRPDTFTQTVPSTNFQTSCSPSADHTLSVMEILQQLASNAESGDVRNLDSVPQPAHPRCDFNHKSVFNDGSR